MAAVKKQEKAQILLGRSVEKSVDAAHPVIDEVPDDATNIFTGDPIPEAVGLQTHNPGYPGFSSGGFVLGAGISLRAPL